MQRAILLLSFLAAALPPAAFGERGNIYSPVGKRDPFKPPALTSSARDVSTISPLEKFAVEQLVLKAVMRGMGKPRAMFEDPDGRTHIVREGDIMGRERATVSRILNSEVIVTERTFNYLGEESLYEKILSLPADKDDGSVRSTEPPKTGAGAMPGNNSAIPLPPANSGGSAPGANGNDGGLVY